MENVAARARCSGCGRGLPFEDWQHGRTQCRPCASVARASVRAPQPPPDERIPLTSNYRAYERMVDEVPDELLDELMSAIEAEAESRRSAPRNDTPAESLLQGFVEEIGIGRSSSEVPWALWGFAAGFALNVAVAKYAQMSTGAPMADFLAPMVIGGVVAGATCAAIGWAVARLRVR